MKIHIFNFSLEDLPGEKWLPVYGFEDYALISQYGRVKRTKESTKAKPNYKERIIRSSVQSNRSLTDKLYPFSLICTITAGKKKYLFNVMRMIYYLFNEKFDYQNHDYTVISRNGNDLDLHPGNLVLLHMPDLKFSQHRSQLSYLPQRQLRLTKEISYSKELILRKARVSCYNKEGIRICTFENIYHAHLQTDLSIDAILRAITDPFTTLRDCYWRSGKKLCLDAGQIRAQEKELEQKQVGIQLTQFDLNGNPINQYYSVAEAAADNKMKESDILKCLNGKLDMAGYFIWKKGNWDTPIPGL